MHGREQLYLRSPVPLEYARFSIQDLLMQSPPIH